MHLVHLLKFWILVTVKLLHYTMFTRAWISILSRQILCLLMLFFNNICFCKSILKRSKFKLCKPKFEWMCSSKASFHSSSCLFLALVQPTVLQQNHFRKTAIIIYQVRKVRKARPVLISGDSDSVWLYPAEFSII